MQEDNARVIKWEIVQRPGYLGKHRDRMCAEWDKIFGKGMWRIAYQWGDKVIDREMALQLYEDGYYEFFKNNKITTDWLVKTASEVYDTAPTNVNAGLSYFVQETPNNHIHDVAIRRAILRCGLTFGGDHLVHVRWKDSEGFCVNPGIVAFHLPHMIVPGEIKDHTGKGMWWKGGTIEDFYQKNKVLQAAR